MPVAAPESGYLAAIDHEELLQLAEHTTWSCAWHTAPAASSSGAANSPGSGRPSVSRRGCAGSAKCSCRSPMHGLSGRGIQRGSTGRDRGASLSLGINDPFTAVACLDRLGEALCRLANRSIPSAFRHDKEGRLRVVARPVTFGTVADAAFHQIRQYGRTSAAVLIRLLETLAAVAEQARREEDRAALEYHALLACKAARQALPEEADREAVECVTGRYSASSGAGLTHRGRKGVGNRRNLVEVLKLTRTDIPLSTRGQRDSVGSRRRQSLPCGLPRP